MPTSLMTIGSLQALRVSEWFVAVSSMILSAEIFKRKDLFADGGLLSWRIDRLSHPEVNHLLSRVGFETVFESRNFLRLQALRFVSAIMLLFTIGAAKPTCALLFTLVVLTLMSHFRASATNDGSDQFTLIVLIACTLAEAVGTTLAYRGACYFIAGEAMIAYSTSGWLKLLERGWQDGSIVTDILASSTYGNRSLYHLFANHRSIAIVVGLAVAAGDCVLGVAALLPPSITLLLLLFGVMFHLGIARVLGLNTFLWAFCATYAPTYFVSSDLHRLMSRT
jgi:hypothetical protein